MILKLEFFFFNFVSNQVVSPTQQEWMHIAAEGLKMKIIKNCKHYNALSEEYLRAINLRT